MAKYVKTEQGYIDMPNFAPAPFKPEGKSYLTFSSSNRFTLSVYDAIKHWNGILEYFSADKVWAVWDGTTTLSAVSDDGEYFLYLRGTGNKEITGFTNGQKYKWVLTGSEIACTGNIENLLDYGIVESGGHPTMASYCYSSMFSGCTSLTKAPALPAKTLAVSCYSSMFSGCTSLTKAPALPAKTLKSDCYQLMFEGCTALTQAPALPATTLADYCYSSMFYGCTALTQAPDLPATTLSHWCYRNMFYGCTELTQAPDLPATTLANNCYESMFSGCTSLTKAPALPAKTLIGGCYSSMFYGCTSLTQAPELPATSLVTNCYDKMFYGCRSIKLSSTQTGEYTQEYIVGYTSNYAYLMFYGTGGTFTETPVKNTYYLSTDNMIVRDTEVATLNGYVGSMIDNSVSNPLNITGATVGQIAKITAVDESGKPTSWEAVDDRLPKVSVSDAGNVLGVEQIGEHEYGYALTHMPNLNDFIPLGITNASPGQFAKVSFVDDFGNPTAWEAADIYEKPASGIPKSDLADYVQTSLAKADTSISYDSQTLTDAQKQQARTNIGAGQPDWNQNDSTQPDYVKNRPFYTGNPVETVLVEESTVSFVNADGMYMAQFPSTFEATVGETYKVYWDGTAYECVCAVFNSYPVIGNLSIMGAGSDTGEPFLMVVANGRVIEIYTADTSASHTVSISVFAPEVVKIDDKYLPISTDDSYGVVKKADIVSAYNFPARAPHDQMVEAIAAFRTGNASIVWNRYKVIVASYASSNDRISVVFADEPMKRFTYSNIDGFYNAYSGSNTYGELQGNQVRIVNDEGHYAVLRPEGVQGDITLLVDAERILFYEGCGLSKYELILGSSTKNSRKKFKVTVDDNGTITATEVS